VSSKMISGSIREIATACAEAAFEAQRSCITYSNTNKRKSWHNLSETEKEEQVTDATNILCGEDPFSGDPEDWFGEIFLEVVKVTGRVLMRGYVRRTVGKKND
jgi:hypothetical protein